MAAILAKILYAEPVPLKSLRPELPAALHELVDRMLAKSPGQRLADGQHLLRAVEALGASETSAPAPVAEQAEGEATETEQHLVSVLLAAPEAPSQEAVTRTLSNHDAAQARAKLESLLEELRARGAKTSLLANNSLLATFLLEHGTATDQATLAGHCALLVKERPARETWLASTWAPSETTRPLHLRRMPPPPTREGGPSGREPAELVCLSYQFGTSAAAGPAWVRR